MIAHQIAEKFRRAIRNDTGAAFTHAQLLWMAQNGLLLLLAKAEIEELIAMKRDDTDDT